jgi:hypothetical protein
MTRRFVVRTMDPTLLRYGTDFMSRAFSHGLSRVVVLTSSSAMSASAAMVHTLDIDPPARKERDETVGH